MQNLTIVFLVLGVGVLTFMFILYRFMREELYRNRQELSNVINNFQNSILSRLDSFRNDLSTLSLRNEERLEKMRQTIDEKLKDLQKDNSDKLEQMRAVVDEKLHATLERRLGESFKLVSQRLELVQQGLGQMQSLAVGVGDLKKVLTNIKTRGTWGEIQLGNLLEQILSPEQFERNVTVKKKTNERVDFAVKLPGRGSEPVWLPIDAKFPKEDYERLVQAQEDANLILVEEASKALENRMKLEARSIKEKYIDPPNTVDFAIMFLPTEGLFAEVLRRPGLTDFLQREYRVAVTGPTTIAAFLSTLNMGFRTLAIEKHSSQVWQLLAAVKLEFEKFGDLLDKTNKKLKEATNTIESATRKSRTIERKLRDVQDVSLSSGKDFFQEIAEPDQVEEEADLI